MNSLSSKPKVYKQPLVSICIPVYNAEKTVVNTLQSILNQTYQNLEIIIVDNASTDNTLNLIGKITDLRLAIYRNSVNIGAERNFSKCIELATGDYIAIFHADDLYKSDMVQKQVQVFLEKPFIGAVFTMANRINEHDEVTGEYKLPFELKNKDTYYFSEIITSRLRNGNFLICPSAMVRSEIYKELAPFNVEKFGTAADLDMWLRILGKCPVAILDEKLMNYRISNIQGGFLYNCLRTEEEDFFKVLDYHLSFMTCTIKDIPNDALNNYEFLRYMDNVVRAVNYINKGQSKNAKTLLEQSFSTKIFMVAMSRIKKPRFLIFLVIGSMLLVLTYLGLEQYICKMLARLQYSLHSTGLCNFTIQSLCNFFIKLLLTKLSGSVPKLLNRNSER